MGINIGGIFKNSIDVDIINLFIIRDLFVKVIIDKSFLIVLVFFLFLFFVGDVIEVIGNIIIILIEGSIGYNGRRVMFIFFVVLIVIDGLNFWFNGDFLIIGNDILIFVFRSGSWYEVGRSVN